MNGTFQPAWWCPGAHLQTTWSSLFRLKPTVRLRRERIELPDGDFLDLDWTPNVSGPIVLILHGLEGSSRSNYGRGILRAASKHGWRGALMHFRGCSGEPNRLPRSYHSGETGDLAYIIKYLLQREPTTPIAAVGFSLGGNVLLKWLGEARRQAPLVAAVAVSVPFVLARAADRLNRGFSRIYQWRLLTCLKQTLKAKQRLMELPLQIRDLTALKSFRDFDEHVTARLHGFRGAEHYYTASSSRPYLKEISIPTLLIQARDDPFMTPDTVPELNELSASTTLELYEQGGHVGFVSGNSPLCAKYWLEERIPNYLQNYFI